MKDSGAEGEMGLDREGERERERKKEKEMASLAPQHCPAAHVALRTRWGRMADYNWSPSYNQEGQN